MLYLKFLPLLYIIKVGPLFITYKLYFYHKYFILNYLIAVRFTNSFYNTDFEIGVLIFDLIIIC